jgi:hypothetical protein
MRPPWWAAFSPVTASVPCAGQHRLLWQDGKLTAVDHPDAESELVLAALGGDQPECVRLVRAWGTHSANLDVLAIGPRSAADTLALPAQTPLWHSGPLMYGRGGVAVSWGTLGGHGARHAARDSSGRLELLELLGLGQGLTFRLMATVAASATTPRTVPKLTAALAGRLAPAVPGWLGIDPDQVKARLYEGDGWGELELTDGQLNAALPARWLASVWAPGLAVIGGKLVVDVTEATWPTARVIAVSRPGTEPVSLRAICKNGQWSVART